jgi:hypothetical protein
MSTNIFMSLYLIMLFFQMMHIFEEIALQAYKLAGSLNKYLRVASLLVFLSYLPLFLILLDLQIGTYLAFFGAILALGNGVIHLVGWIKTRSFRGTLGAGVFTGIPLGMMGGIVLYQLISMVQAFPG